MNKQCVAYRWTPYRTIRGALFLVLSLGALVASAPARAQSCVSHSDITNLRSDHLWKLNSLRLRNEQAKLEPNGKLDDAAQAYACLLAQTGHFDHVGPDGSTPSDRILEAGYQFCVNAENLAKGYPSIDKALIGWISSPGHYRNLIRPNVKEVGLGVAYLAKDEARAPSAGPSSLSQLAETLGGERRSPPSHISKGTVLIWVQLFAAKC